MFKDYPITTLTIDQKYRLKAQINLSNFLFRNLTFTFLLFPGSIPRALTIGDDNIIDFSRRQSLTLISVTSQLSIPIIKMAEDVEIITKESTPIGFSYRESTPLSNIDETII